MTKKQMLGFLVFFLIILFYPKENCLAAPYVIINNAQSVTKVRNVNLSLRGPEDVVKMMVSNDINFSGAEWESFKSSKGWYLSYGNGTKSVYVKFMNSFGVKTKIFNDTIRLDVPKTMRVDFQINSSTPETNTRNVTLRLQWSEGVESIRIGNANDLRNVDWTSVNDNILWQLSPGSGKKTVFIEFRDANGAVKKLSKNIKYNQSANYINEGTLLKGKSSTIYYLGFDGKIHPFFDSIIYNSWFPDFNGIFKVSDAKIKQYSVGRPICLKQGTWLVKFQGKSRIYAVEPGCGLRQIRSEVEARILFGSNWQKRVLTLNPIMESFYNILEQDSINTKDDFDNDGVEADVENDYGSSDNKVDSDNDGLSDYEEINYWFTDPVSVDTDGDGIRDGKEILNGTLPTGAGNITSLPKDTYAYTLGSVIKKKNGEYYYRLANGKYYRVLDNSFSSNNLQKKFAISETLYNIPFSSSGNLKNSDPQVVRPQIKNSAGNLIDL